MCLKIICPRIGVAVEWKLEEKEFITIIERVSGKYNEENPYGIGYTNQVESKNMVVQKDEQVRNILYATINLL